MLGEVPRALARAAPGAACTASTSAGRLRTRRSAGPRRARTGSSAAPRAPAPSSRRPRHRRDGPDRRPGGVVRRRRASSRRPSAAKSAHSDVSPTGSNVARADRDQPSAARAAIANVPRRAVGASGPGSSSVTPRASPERSTSCRRPGAGPELGPPGGSAQLNRSPTVSGSGPGFSTHHSNTPTGKRAPIEVAGDDRRELLAGEAHRDAEAVGLERLPGPREQRVIRAATHRQIPAPGGQVRRPERGQDDGPAGTVAASPAGPTYREKPSAATGSNRCWPTSRCQRATSPRNVRPMLPVPRPPIGTPAHSPSSIIGRATRGCPTSGQGTPIARRQAGAG